MDGSLMRQYEKLVEFLGLALGPDYEIALHDMTNKNHSIVAIANNHVSGRSVGSPLTNMALQVLMDKSYLNQDYRLHYQGISRMGKVLRSCTFFIKDEDRLIGMLCINFDDSRYQELGARLMQLCHPDVFAQSHYRFDSALNEANAEEKPMPEQFHPESSSVAKEAVRQELERLNVAADRLTTQERCEIIGRLVNSGVFLLKGAAADVAEELRCSLPSVYRYVSKLKNSKR